MFASRLLPLVLAAASLSLAQPAFAQADRTWVSGLGNDANPCSRSAPCRTFAGAIAKTAPGGEIDALDPGPFAAVTITKPITIDGGGGQVASVLAAGTNGIVVQVGFNDTVILRNLRINGVKNFPNGGLNGIRYLSGSALHVENCNIFGFNQTGIDINLVTQFVATRVYISDTTVSTSGGGISARNGGSGPIFMSVFRATLAQNNFGLKADGNGGTGQITVALSDSLVTGSGVGVQADAGPGNASVEVVRSSIVNNYGVGLGAFAQGGHTATVVSSANLISGNAPGLLSSGGGQIISYQNNNLNGNAPDGAFTGTLLPK